MKLHKLKVLGAALAVSSLFLVAACGSDSDGASSAPETSSAAPAPASSEATVDGVDYGAILEEAMKVFPAEYQGPTEPAKAPAGIFLADISCNQQLQGCVDLAAGTMEAAKAAGWDAKTYDGQGTPDEQNKQILAAVADGADVIILNAVDPLQVQLGLKAAKDAGAIILSNNNAYSAPNPVVEAPDANTIWPIGDILQDQAYQGKIQADWIIADSQGAANVLALNDTGFPSAKVNHAGFVAEMKTCTGCITESLDFPSTDAGPVLAQNVVGYLQSHPDVNYVFVPYDPAVPSIVAALHTAGLEKQVKVTAYLGNKQNLELVKNSDVQYVDVAEACFYVGWALVDQAIRALNGQPAIEPFSENAPMQLLTKDNLPADISVSWDPPFDYRSKYLALWK